LNDINMAKHESQIVRDEHDESVNAKRVISAATIYAVVNTGTAAGQASIALDNSIAKIGFVTVHQGSTPWVVGGDVAAGGADSGNPVKVGAKYNLTQPTNTDGWRGDLQLDNRGNLRVVLQNGSNVAALTLDNANGVAESSTNNKLFVVNRNTVLNGTNWDRMMTVTNATNSSGTGITAAGILAQFDDTSPTAITENQFGNLRMSANRNQYVTLRDAAGNERGLNIDVNNNIGATNGGTTKTLIHKTLGFSTTSVTTIAVPTNTFKITNVLINSTATVRINIKSGATYLTGNASIGIVLNPGGGWVETGSPDSPTYIGLSTQAAIVFEKFDMTSTVALVSGKVIYFDE
jgi:hypothetical protein